MGNLFPSLEFLKPFQILLMRALVPLSLPTHKKQCLDTISDKGLKTERDSQSTVLDLRQSLFPWQQID